MLSLAMMRSCERQLKASDRSVRRAVNALVLSADFYYFSIMDISLYCTLRPCLNPYSEAVTRRSFLGKDALKICSKFTGEHRCRSVISIKLLSNVIDITLRHGCSTLLMSHFGMGVLL